MEFNLSVYNHIYAMLALQACESHLILPPGRMTTFPLHHRIASHRISTRAQPQTTIVDSPDSSYSSSASRFQSHLQ